MVPRSNEEVGRVTSGTAYAYLGYAYLTMASEQADKKAEYLNAAVEAFRYSNCFLVRTDCYFFIRTQR